MTTSISTLCHLTQPTRLRPVILAEPELLQESQRESWRGEVCLHKWQHNPPPVWRSAGCQASQENNSSTKKNHFVKTNFTYFFPTKREMIYMRNKIDNLSETLGDLLVLSWIFSYPVTFEMFSTNLGRGKHIMIFVQLPLENLISIFSI